MTTLTEIRESFATKTVAELRKIATKDYPVSPRGLKKDELVTELTECVWAELENAHSDEGHEDAPEADCPICAEAGAKPKARKGRTFVPGYTMVQAFEAAAPELAGRVIATASATEDGVDVPTEVESVLMDLADTDKPAGADVATDLGRVLGGYLREDRTDRYGYVLSKIVQAVGRNLKEAGFNRRSGLKEEQA